MYEGTLPRTGAGLMVGGTAFQLSWVIAAGVALVAAGVLLTRFTPRRRQR
jgi:hypothetical protein